MKTLIAAAVLMAVGTSVVAAQDYRERREYGERREYREREGRREDCERRARAIRVTERDVASGRGSRKLREVLEASISDYNRLCRR